MSNAIRTIGASLRQCVQGKRHATRRARAIQLCGHGLTLCTLLASLQGCGKPEIVRQTVYVAPPAPVALLALTEIPDYTGTTNGDLEDYVHQLRASIGLCNADKRGILTVWPVNPPPHAAPGRPE